MFSHTSSRRRRQPRPGDALITLGSVFVVLVMLALGVLASIRGLL